MPNKALKAVAAPLDVSNRRMLRILRAACSRPLALRYRPQKFLLWCVLGFLAVVIIAARIYFLRWEFGRWDFEVIYPFAEEFIKSGFLYSTNPSDYMPSVPLGYPHPPLSPALLVLAIKLGFSKEDIIGFLSFANIVCYVLSIVSCWLASGIKKTWGCFFAALGAAFCLAPLVESNLTMLLLEPCLLLLCSLSLLALFGSREFLAGLLIGVAAALKIYPTVFMGYFLVSRRWRAAVGVVVGWCACLAFSCWILGVENNWVYYSIALPHQLKEYPYLFFYENTSIASYALYFDVLSPQYAKVFGSVVFVTFFLVSIFPSYKDHAYLKNMSTVVALDYACLISLLILCMPNSWWNYQIHLLIPSMVMAVFFARQKGRILGVQLLFWAALVDLVITAAMAIDNDIDYFTQMNSEWRMLYIVARGLPNLVLFLVPLIIRWRIFLGKCSAG